MHLLAFDTANISTGEWIAVIVFALSFVGGCLRLGWWCGQVLERMDTMNDHLKSYKTEHDSLEETIKDTSTSVNNLAKVVAGHEERLKNVERRR